MVSYPFFHSSCTCRVGEHCLSRRGYTVFDIFCIHSPTNLLPPKFSLHEHLHYIWSTVGIFLIFVHLNCVLWHLGKRKDKYCKGMKCLAHLIIIFYMHKSAIFSKSCMNKAAFFTDPISNTSCSTDLVFLLKELLAT